MAAFLPFLFLLLTLSSKVCGRECPDPDCSTETFNNDTILFPSPDCRNFYSCTWGFPTLLGCPPGLRFNADVPGCVPEYMADCSPCEEPKPEEEKKKSDDSMSLISYFPFLHKK